MRLCIPEQDKYHWSFLELPMSKGIPRMKKFATLMLPIIHSEKGTTSIEYALLASLIFVAIVVSVTQLGGGVTRMYQLIATCIPR